MTAAELAGGFELPAAGELPTHIEDHYLRRVRELPEATQQLMLVAAAEPLGDPALVLRAGRRLDIETSALAPAEAAESVGDRRRVSSSAIPWCARRSTGPRRWSADSGCTKSSPR